MKTTNALLVSLMKQLEKNPQMDLKAEDRYHRIGQTKHVHVYRLATFNSVEGRVLKKAFKKLKLEHLVIGKGQFQQERKKPNSLEYFEEPTSSIIEAAVLLHPWCSEKTETESGKPSYTTRLLVPTCRIGYLIGKSGAVINEIDEETHKSKHLRISSGCFTG